MGACDHCLPLRERSAWWWEQRTGVIPGRIDAARREAANWIARARGKVSGAYAAWRAAYHAWRTASAELDAVTSALAGAGGAPLHPADVSTTPRPDWIEVPLAPGRSMWARTQEAAQALGSAGSVADLLARQADAATRVATSWSDVQRTLDEIDTAEQALRDVIDHWEAVLDGLHDDLVEAGRQERLWDQRYRACVAACERGRPLAGGLAGVGGALAAIGVVAVVLAQPFGGGQVGQPVEAAEPTVAATPREEPGDDAPSPTVSESPEPTIARQIALGCTGTDHFPDQPVTNPRDGSVVDSPSKQVFVFTVAGVPVGAFVDVAVDGPSGPVVGTGRVDDDGRVVVEVPLFQYGEHTVTDVAVDDGTGTRLEVPVDVPETFTVADPEQPCDTTSVPTGQPADPVTTTVTDDPTNQPDDTSTGGAADGETTGGTAGTEPDGDGSGGDGTGGVRTELDPPPVASGPPPAADAPTTIAAGTPGTETNGPLAGAGLLSLLGGLLLMGGSRLATRRDPAPDDHPGANPREDESEDPDVASTPPATAVEEPGLLDGLGSLVTETVPDLVAEGTAWLSEKKQQVEDAAHDLATHVYGGTYNDGTTTDGLVSQVADGVFDLASDVLGILASAPSPPPRTEVRLDTGGRGDDSLNGSQTFHIEVTTARPADGDPPATIEVELESSSGDDETVTLAWTGNVDGPARYRSAPLTLNDGGEGGGKTTVFGLEFSSGGFNSLWFDDGGTATIRFDGQELTFTTYDTWVQQGIGRSMQVIERVDAFWTEFDRQTASLPPEEVPDELRLWSQTVHEMADLARRNLASDELDTTKFAQLTTYARWIGEAGFAHVRLRGTGDLWAMMGSHIRHKREQIGQDVLMRGLSGITIGLYRTVMQATPTQSVWTLFTGRDVMNRSVGWSDRVFAALELAGWLSLAGGFEARALADSLPSAQRLRFRRDANLDEVDNILDTEEGRGFRRTTAEEAASAVPEPAIRGRAAGQAVEFSEEFGMLRNRARWFQSIADTYGVIIRVRASNFDALEWMTRGHPPKHVKLKSKTINEIDEIIGAPSGSRGLVGYFKPKMPRRTAAMTDERWAKIKKRYTQRLREFADNARDMRTLQDKGLVDVRRGVVIDTGLSNTRLVGDELYSLPGGPGGTGKAFTGDHDIFDVTLPDGSPVPDDLGSRVLTDVMAGVTDVQHPWHTGWNPHLLTGLDAQKYWQNIDIDTSIRNGHRGKVKDGAVRPTDESTEPLLEFSPGGSAPRTAYDTSPLPQIPDGAPSRPGGGRAR